MAPAIETITGDITTLAVDVIVNAANTTLLGGGGVDGAIHQAGGPAILEECKKIRHERLPDGLPTGEAVATGAGNLKARWVVHAVGPIWYGGCLNEETLLLNAYLNSYRLAAGLGAKSVAFPAISTGAYGFPKERAARVVMRFIEAVVKKGPIEKVLFVFFSEGDRKVFEAALPFQTRAPV